MNPVKGKNSRSSADLQSASRTSNGMNGILLVDKPAGWTSHDVVAKVRSILRQVSSQQSSVISQKGLETSDKRLATPLAKPKVGHTGILDPFATGLLVLVLGTYTKRAGEFSKQDKTYRAELTLGKTSTTGDPEGEIAEVSTKKPTKNQIKNAIAHFIRTYEQMPPAHSAKKINGQRAYKLARAGKEVKLEPKEVTVYRLQVTEYQYPKVKFTVEVSSGTYIRSLAVDIGQKLGTGAYLSALRRTKVGKFDIKDALPVKDISAAIIKRHLKAMVASQ